MERNDTYVTYSETPVVPGSAAAASAATGGGGRGTPAGRATPEAIADIAAQIWRTIGASGVAADDEAGNSALLAKLQEEFKDFGTSFPIVLRWMVQMRVYSKKALLKYLLKHASADLSTRQGFLELQAEYLVLLQREQSAHPNEKQLQQYRASIIKVLLEEDREFMEVSKQVEEEFDRTAVAIDQDRRRKLHAHVLASRLATSAAAQAAQAGSATQ